MDVGDNTTTGNGSLDERVQLFITADRQLQVARCDALNLEVLACVASELKHLGGEVLKDRSGVDRRSCADAAVGAYSALEESVDSSDGELKFQLENLRAAANNLPRVQREPISTWGFSWTCRFRTCLPCHLCLFRPKI